GRPHRALHSRSPPHQAATYKASDRASGRRSPPTHSKHRTTPTPPHPNNARPRTWPPTPHLAHADDPPRQEGGRHMSPGAALARIRLNPHSRAVQRDLRNATDMHRTLMRLVPDQLGSSPRQAAGLLYRLDVT